MTRDLAPTGNGICAAAGLETTPAPLALKLKDLGQVAQNCLLAEGRLKPVPPLAVIQTMRPTSCWQPNRHYRIAPPLWS